MFKTPNTQTATVMSPKNRLAQLKKQLGIALLTLSMVTGLALATIPSVTSNVTNLFAQAEPAVITPPCTAGCGTITPPVATVTPPVITPPCTAGCGTITPPPCSAGCGTITPPPTTITPPVVTTTPIVVTPTSPIVTPIVTPTPTPVVTPITTPTPTPVITPIVTPTPTPVITPIVTPTPEPKLALEKTCRVGDTLVSALCNKVTPKDTLYYTLAVKNVGNVALTNVTATDTYNPAQLIWVGNVTGTSVISQTAGTTKFGEFNLADGAVKYITYTMKVAEGLENGTVIENTAVANGKYNKTDVVSNVAKARVTVEVKPPVLDKAIALEKTCYVTGTTTPCNSAKAGLKAGSSVTYVLKVTNSGRTDLTVNTLVDTYDVKLVAISNVIPTGKWDTTAGTVTWTDLGLYKAGSSKEYKFDAKLGDKVIAGSVVKNTAKVTAQDGLFATANYEFSIPTVSTTTVAPPVQRTGAADSFLVTLLVVSFGAGAYFFLNNGKVSMAFGGNKGQF
jgi:uncharacterized repeat protein (TIGR01451 family)